MNRYLLVLATTFVVGSAAFGQRAGIAKAVINTPGLRAEVCKTKVENFLVHEYGVSSVRADYRRHTVTVTWYTNRTNIENIKTALANMGYNADDVTADPDALKRLPPGCKPEITPGDSTFIQ